MKTVRLRVTMREVVPRVERVIDVPAAITLDELHEVLQVAIGWTDSHLHQFRTEDTVYAVPFEDWGEDREVDERGIRLSTLPTRFIYAYDLGDDWQHDVEVLGRGDDQPGCVYGEGSCPPEDCGGVGGYADLLDVLADPRHREHESMREWTGDRLKPFDQEATSQRVRDAVGAVPESVRIVLDLLADGVKLTPGGRLPRTVVRAVQEQRPDWNPMGRPASIEEDLLPLAVLHDLLRHVRLVRLANGVLRPTKTAADELETVRRLRSWFEANAFHTVTAERAVALVVARGPLQLPAIAAEVLPLLGHGWSRGGKPITTRDLEDELRNLAHQLQALDLITRSRSEWSPGPSARSLLPGANLLADLL
ncbi:plasmid pRiA4b ORF-3 family protein [Nocardioides sp.]|uniref:plasmid pRiA4b ORF-3 family protein n=1 Tax=Nocardioides sp. TaxID=35761 RepID=UPI002ED8B823